MEVKKKKKKGKRDSDSESDTDVKRGRKKKSHVSDGEDSSDEEERRRKKDKKKKKRDSSESDSSESEPERPPKKSKSIRRSPGIAMDAFDTGSGGSVYRALKAVPCIAGVTEAPCGKCPSFEFCKEGGPVNPEDCVYYTEWLKGGMVTNVEEE